MTHGIVVGTLLFEEDVEVPPKETTIRGPCGEARNLYVAQTGSLPCWTDCNGIQVGTNHLEGVPYF